MMASKTATQIIMMIFFLKEKTNKKVYKKQIYENQNKLNMYTNLNLIA